MMTTRTTTLVGMLSTVAVLSACGGGGVTDPPPAGVATVTVSLAASQVFVGQTSQGTAMLRDAQSNVLTGRSIVWSSSNTAVATVGASTGLVTGVTAGTATISASSEGKTGQAGITVAVDPATVPQISNITVTQNGQAANLGQVAGKLTLSFSVQVPAGYNGTLTVKVDTAEFHRETLSAPALSARLLAGSEALPASVTVDRVIEMETSRTTFVVGADQLQELPSIRNGSRIAQLLVTPAVQGGPSTQQQVAFTANNPPHAHGFAKFGAQTAVGTDGLTYTGGAGVGAVTFATYGTEVITGFEATFADMGAQYGHGGGGIANVVQAITRDDLKFFPIPAFPIERSNQTFVLTRVTMNGTNIVPQVDYFGNSAFTTDLIGSGFANTPQQVLGLTPPSGKTWLEVAQPPADLFNTALVHVRATIDPFHLDNLGPRQSSLANEPVFGFLDRMTTVGGAARWPTYGFGANDNQISARYEFEGGLRTDRLTDVTGIDALQTRYYAGPVTDMANLYTAQYLVGSTVSLGESSGSRLYTAGARVYDRRGNSSDWSIRTTGKNPWNVSGQSSSGGSIGVDQGAFGFTQLRATLNLTSMPTESTWNTSTIDPSLCWVFGASSSVVGLPGGWLSGRGKLNDQWGFGAGTARDKFQILNSAGGATGGTSTVFTSALVADILADVSGPQGLYEFEFKAADNAARYIGDNMWPRTFRFLWDYQPPSNVNFTYNAPVTAGVSNSGVLTGTDNYAIREALVGIRFDFGSSAFTGGKAYVPIGRIPVPGTLGGTRTTNLSLPVTGVVPLGFWFFNPGTGVVDVGNFHKSDGGALQLQDMARNLSSVHFAPFINNEPAPSLTNVSQAKSSISSTNWCPGTCSSGGDNIVDLIFDYLDPRPSGAPMFMKAEWFALPFGGIVRPLGRSTTVNEVPEGGGRRITYSLSLDLDNYCGPSGSTLVFPLGWAADGRWAVKSNPFYSVTVRAAARYSNNCNFPF